MQMQKAPIEKPMRVHITFDTPSKYHPPKFPKTQIYAGVLVCHTPDRNIPPLRRLQREAQCRRGKCHGRKRSERNEFFRPMIQAKRSNGKTVAAPSLVRFFEKK